MQRSGCPAHGRRALNPALPGQLQKRRSHEPHGAAPAAAPSPLAGPSAPLLFKGRRPDGCAAARPAPGSASTALLSAAAASGAGGRSSSRGSRPSLANHPSAGRQQQRASEHALAKQVQNYGSPLSPRPSYRQQPDRERRLYTSWCPSGLQPAAWCLCRRSEVGALVGRHGTPRQVQASAAASAGAHCGGAKMDRCRVGCATAAAPRGGASAAAARRPGPSAPSPGLGCAPAATAAAAAAASGAPPCCGGGGGGGMGCGGSASGVGANAGVGGGSGTSWAPSRNGRTTKRSASACPAPGAPHEPPWRSRTPPGPKGSGS